MGNDRPQAATSGTDLDRLLAVLDPSLHADFDQSRPTRAVYSSDAGNYRILPLAVYRPRRMADVITVVRACLGTGIPLTSRGAGTSCAGNAIGPGLVIDFNAHLNRVIEVDPHRALARVEPGCIQATLQQAAAPYGLRFGPDPSTQNRCTIGGMVGNNACGPHATAWGTTAANIESLRVIDGFGRVYDVNQFDVPGLESLIDRNEDLIKSELGRFGRQVSGYCLQHMLAEQGRNLAAMLVGTEGTLVTVLEVTVRLVPVPKAPVLVALGYPDMVAAGDDVTALLPHHPLAVEGMDRRLVDVVRAHAGEVPQLPAGEGWLLCEVSGETIDQALDTARALVDSSAAADYLIYPPGSDATRLWRIRADGAGLGGRTPVSAAGTGNEQAWPGWEDAAVPPENLGAYLRDFNALMAEHGIDGLLYGHFGDGCVHVRLDLPFADEPQRARDFLIASARLVARHGGSLSGEHGDGRARSELLKYLYSPQMLDLFAQVKQLFDPHNLLNPGVLTAPAQAAAAASPAAIDGFMDHLRRPGAKPIPAAGGFQFHADHGDFTTAVHRCTGVAKCRAEGGFMCPSFQASGEDIDATRGRARILQEVTAASFLTGWDDPALARALDLCLACKACGRECPAGVDMARYRSEALYRRYRGRIRPLTHYFLGWLPALTRITARYGALARLANRVMAVNPLRKLAFRVAGIDPRRSMPPLQDHTFTDRVARARRAPAGECAGALHDHPRYVLVWADSFSQTLDDRGAHDTLTLLQRAGFTPLVAPADICCGLTWITTGQLPVARRKLTDLVDRLGPYVRAGIPIIGIEPSCTAVLRDDLLELGVDHPDTEAVSRATFTLAELLTGRAGIAPAEGWLPKLDGVKVVAQPHCHHYSVMGWQADRELLRQAGAELIELQGCCGLAGNFGMEQGHYETSVAVAQASLLPQLAAHPDAVYLADGFSCRTQAEQLAGRAGIHLASLLLGGRHNI